MHIRNLASDKSNLELFSVDCVALLSRNNKMKAEKKLFLQTLIDVRYHKALKFCCLETFLTYCCFCL